MPQLLGPPRNSYKLNVTEQCLGTQSFHVCADIRSGHAPFSTLSQLHYIQLISHVHSPSCTSFHFSKSHTWHVPTYTPHSPHPRVWSRRYMDKVTARDNQLPLHLAFSGFCFLEDKLSVLFACWIPLQHVPCHLDSSPASSVL